MSDMKPALQFKFVNAEVFFFAFYVKNVIDTVIFQKINFEIEIL